MWKRRYSAPVRNTHPACVNEEGNEHRLTGTLTHLSPLAAKTTHALLLPLLTHTSGDLKEKSDLIILAKSVSGKGSSGELGVSRNETDHVAGDELLVLDHALEVRDGGGAVDSVSRRGTGGGGNNNLHLF